MVAAVSRLIRHNTHTLRSRLVLLTTLMLVLSCSALSWHFVSRQIDSSTEALLKNSEQLASQLAATTHYSVIVKDSRRIQELIQRALTLDDVAYVFIASHENVVLGAGRTQELKQLTGSRMASDWLPLLLSRRAQALASRTHLAPISIRIVEGRPVTESSFTSTTERWIAVLLGSDRPRLFDLVMPINKMDPPESDPALGLSIDETGLSADRSQGTSS